MTEGIAPCEPSAMAASKCSLQKLTVHSIWYRVKWSHNICESLRVGAMLTKYHSIWQIFHLSHPLSKVTRVPRPKRIFDVQWALMLIYSWQEFHFWLHDCRSSARLYWPLYWLLMVFPMRWWRLAYKVSGLNNWSVSVFQRLLVWLDVYFSRICPTLTIDIIRAPYESSGGK